MGVAVHAGWRDRAGFRQHDGAPLRQPLEAGMRSGPQRPAPRIGLRQHRIDQHGIACLAIVEQGQAAIAMPEKAQRRRHALDRALQEIRHLDPRHAQRRPDIDQVAQHGHVHAGAARGMAAIGEDLRQQLARQQLQTQVAPGFPTRQAEARLDQAANGDDQLRPPVGA